MRNRKVFHGETPKRYWPNVRQSYSASCRGLGFPKLLPICRDYSKVQNKEGPLPTKICSKCKVEKPKSEFCPKERSDKYAALCKSCHCERAKKSYAKNPEPARERGRKYLAEHREEINKKSLERYYENREYNINRHVAYKKNRYKEDPSYRIGVGLSNRINKVLRGVGGAKSARTVELLGCPGVWLEVHLESLFKPGMTWENYGPVWHVDHVRPCASFDLRIPQQQRLCFHWTNLQPLFAAENLQKGATYVGPL